MPTVIRGHEPGLYIGERGDIVCAEHAPYRGTDTWRWGHYIRITEGFERLWASEAKRDGLPAKYHTTRCETCGINRTQAEAQEVA
jgi:hypothetical protein